MSVLPKGYWPECAVCAKPVDEISEHYETFIDRVVVRIRCHQHTETINLDGELLAAFERTGIDPNWRAFSGEARRLTPAKEKQR